MATSTAAVAAEDAPVAGPASSRGDVVNAYRALLGRNPESNAVIGQNQRRSPEAVVAVLARSGEFGAILARLPGDRPPPHAWLEPEELQRAAQWAVARGQIPPEAMVAAALPGSLLLGLLEAPAVMEALAAQPDAVRVQVAALRAASGRSTLMLLSQPADVADERMLVRLLHGPEAAAGEAPAGPVPTGNLHHLLRRHLAAPRFRSEVLEPLLAGREPPGLLTPALDASSCAAWLAQRLGAEVAGPRDVAAVLAALLALPAVEEMLARIWPGEQAALQAALPGLAAGRMARDTAAEAGRAGSDRSPELGPMVGSCDVLVLSEDGVFVEGWTDDRFNPVVAVTIAEGTHRIPIQRNRRPDAEKHLGLAHGAELGLWAAAALPRAAAAGAPSLGFVYANGAHRGVVPTHTLRLSRRDAFEHLLGFFGRRIVLGNPTARALADLDAGLGDTIAALHGRLRGTRKVGLRADFRCGTAPRVSVVCVLYGIPDFLYLLVAQFARFGPLDGFEFVFVSNSPELEEALLRDAELAAFVFQATVRLVSLNQNCGFSHANNVGIAAASADAIAVVNPDVFPRDAAAVRHLLALAEAGLGTRLLGGKLFYADGSVMHDGMYFEPEPKLSALCAAPVWTVEHYRKGFADRPGGAIRAVPAISGAFMLFDRGFFERLGRFEEDFVFGHYEDADLCLRARGVGGQVLLDPELAFWHYEGRGSPKRPEHAGSAYYNRWLFSRRWSARLDEANRA